MDLAYSGAAAVYGAAKSKGVSIELDVDDGLKKILQSSLPVWRVDHEAAVKMTSNPNLFFLLQWELLFGADSGFKYYRDQARKESDSSSDH